MSIISWILLAILACLLSYKIIRNKKREHAYQILVNRVKGLRLNKMLQFIGADRDEFLRVIPEPDIDQLIERCSYCGTIDTCDSYMRDGHRVESMSFCPNYKSLTEHSKVIYYHRRH